MGYLVSYPTNFFTLHEFVHTYWFEQKDGWIESCNLDGIKKDFFSLSSVFIHCNILVLILIKGIYYNDIPKENHLR